MRPLLHPRLVNGPGGDPAVYVDALLERRALLLDLGTLDRLAPRALLRLTHVFVSHAHMDHFVGFDRLLRVWLHQDRTLRLFGPAPFVAQVGHRLAAYTWNLVAGYANDLVLAVTEVDPEGATRSARFRSQAGFVREEAAEPTGAGGVLLDDDTVRVRTAVLDHGTPCLAFLVEEKTHVNVWKTGLRALGLAPGPWLAEVKRAVARGEPDTYVVRACCQAGGSATERALPLGTLRRELLSVTPGQRIAYVVDAAPHPDNARRILALLRGADVGFVEAAFLDADAGLAAERHHLTAGQAGRLARQAAVRRLVPFHFSPRYAGREARLVEEALGAFSCEPRTIPRARRTPVELFTVGDETNHHAHDRACPECWEGYPEPCRCGGLMHAAGGEGEEDPDGNVLLVTRCDRCGRDEDQLDEV